MSDDTEYTKEDAADALEAMFAQALTAPAPTKGETRNAAPSDEVEDGEEEFASDDSTDVDVAPTEESTSQEDEEVEEPDENPTILAPHSWNAERKAAFTQLPRDMQEYIAGKENERDNIVKQSLNQKAEHAKAVQAELAQMNMKHQQNVQTLNGLAAMIVPELEQLSQIDWTQLSVTDQYEYTRLKQLQTDLTNKWAGLQQAHQHLQQQQQEVFQETVSKRIQEQLVKAYEEIPEFNFTQDPNGKPIFKDLAKATALNDAMQKTFRSYGFSDNDAAGLYSDARMVKALARLAVLEQKESARANAMLKKASPQVNRLSAPNAPIVNGSGKGSRDYKQAMDRVRSGSGRPEDAAAALLARFNK